MRPSKAYLIDPYKKRVSTIVIKSYDDIYKRIGDTYCLGPIFDSGDTLFIDDAGLLKDNQAFFCIHGDHRPLAGYGVILGTDEEGESCDVKLSYEIVVNITYFPLKDAVEKFLRESDYLTPKVRNLSNEEFEQYLRGEL